MYIKELKEKLGSEKVNVNETVLYRHSQDESPHPASLPDVVCFPIDKEDVKETVRIATKYKIPITPYGAGTGLEGQAIPIQKGIVISFENMNQLVEFSPENLTVTVKPGMTRLRLNEIVNREGLFFPLDPGADASIGGMVATNASGTTAVRYGSMREQVLDLEVVLMDGSIIHTGSQAKKSSSGYHLNGLFVGSEGTLGIVTEVTLRLHGIPEHTIAARCTFPTIQACVEAAHMILSSGIPVLRMELVDSISIRQVNGYGGYDFPVAESIFLEFAGFQSAVEEEVKLAHELLTDLGCLSWDVAKDSMERSQLWKARHEMSYSFRHIKGKKALGSDVCVPISRLAELVEYTRFLAEKEHLLMGILGHMGDGNYHSIIVYDPNNAAEHEAAIKVNEAIVFKAIELKGTSTGEHGVGLGKIKFQEAEHGSAIPVFRALKTLFDPGNLLNPGKIFT